MEQRGGRHTFELGGPGPSAYEATSVRSNGRRPDTKSGRRLQSDELTRVLAECVLAQLASDCGVNVQQLKCSLTRVAAGQATAPSGAPLTVAEVAARVGLDHQAVRRAIKRGELTARKIGSRVIVYERDFAAWLETCRVKATSDRTSTVARTRDSRNGPEQGLRRLLETSANKT